MLHAGKTLSCSSNQFSAYTKSAREGELLGLNSAAYVPLASQCPYSIIWSILLPTVDLILVTFGQICNFRDPNLVTFYFYELTSYFSGALRARRASGAPWVNKSTHPRKFGNHVTDRPTVRPHHRHTNVYSHTF